MKLGQALKAARHRVKLDQHEVATALGVGEDYLSLLERDLRIPSLELLEKLANLYGVSVSYIVFQAEHKIEPLGTDLQILLEFSRKVTFGLAEAVRIQLGLEEATEGKRYEPKGALAHDIIEAERSDRH